MDELDLMAIFRVFNQHQVDYIVIGGVAVGVYGYVRATKDLDLVPNPDPDNLERLSSALKEIDAKIDQIGDLDSAVGLDPEGLGMGGNFVTSTKLGRLDIMQFQGDRDLFKFLSPSTIEVDVDDFKVKVCSLADLCILKRETGRDADILDIEEIEKVKKSKDDTT